MTIEGLVAASEEEVRLYRALVVAYESMDRAVVTQGPLDAAELGDAAAAADAALASLREVTAALGPERVSSCDVPKAVTVLWRETARLAARAAELNAHLAAEAAARREVVAARLATLADGRRALAAYRPATSSLVAGQRA